MIGSLASIVLSRDPEMFYLDVLIRIALFLKVFCIKVLAFFLCLIVTSIP